MQPGKSSITEIFNKSNQYVIPVFQRGYVWTLEKQIAPLWVDIVDRANASIEHMFMFGDGVAFIASRR